MTIPHRLEALGDLPAGALVSARELSLLAGRSRASLWRDVQAGRLPKPVAIGPQTRRWHDYRAAEVDRQFDYALKNGASSSGKTRTIASIFHAAKQNGYVPQRRPQAQIGGAVPPFDLLQGIPAHLPDGMDPNEFVGPRVGRAQLFPVKAISLFVALGSVGKTSTLMAMACRMASGEPWGTDRLQVRRGMFFSVEETQTELWRKFGASMDGLPL